MGPLGTPSPGHSAVTPAAGSTAGHPFPAGQSICQRTSLPTWRPQDPLSGIKNQGRKTPVLPTHDIDTLEGLRTLSRCSFPSKSPPERGQPIILCPAPTCDEALMKRSWHAATKSACMDMIIRTRRPSCQPRDGTGSKGHAFASRLGGCGYRSPSLVRTQALIDDLAQDMPIAASRHPAGCFRCQQWLRSAAPGAFVTMARPDCGRYRCRCRGMGPCGSLAIARRTLRISGLSHDLISRSGGVEPADPLRTSVL